MKKYKTSINGYVSFPAAFKGTQFRFNGYSNKNKLIYPGCNTGTIKTFKNGMQVKMNGEDCGVYECSNICPL